MYGIIRSNAGYKKYLKKTLKIQHMRENYGLQ